MTKTGVQSVIVKKKFFPTIRSAKSVVKSLGFNPEYKPVDETKNTYRFRQFEPPPRNSVKYYVFTKPFSPAINLIIVGKR